LEVVCFSNNIHAGMLAIKFKEVDLYTQNLDALGTQVALIAGFAFTSITEFSIPEHVPQYLRWALSRVVKDILILSMQLSLLVLRVLNSGLKVLRKRM
jgi:hypothetical protein